jgi:hypothetical protein
MPPRAMHLLSDRLLPELAMLGVVAGTAAAREMQRARIKQRMLMKVVAMVRRRGEADTMVVLGWPGKLSNRAG